MESAFMFEPSCKPTFTAWAVLGKRKNMENTIKADKTQPFILFFVLAQFFVFIFISLILYRYRSQILRAIR